MRVVGLVVLLMASCHGYVIRGTYCSGSFIIRARFGPIPTTPRTAPTAAATAPASIAPSATTDATTAATASPAASASSTTIASTALTSNSTAATMPATITTTTASTTSAYVQTSAAEREGLRLGVGITGLGTSLRHQLPSPGNALLSPLSIASVLAALQMGARGSTADQIAALLGQSSTSDQLYWQQLGSALRAINASTGVVARLANAVVLDKSLSLNTSFENDVKNILSSEALAADFAGNPAESTDFINQWVSNKTHAKIPKILEEPLGPDTVLAVASALYFNGAWSEQFMTDATRREPFTVSDTEVIEVDMMFHETSALFAWDDTIGCQVLGLPYKDENFALFVVLPNEPGAAGLARLESQLSPSALQQLLRSADWTELPYYVPRMRLEASINLNAALAAAGVTDLFDATQADLSGILSNNGSAAPLFVNDVLHSVVMDVTETGTEAAAATVATSTRSGSSLEFRVDHPFLFVLQHRPSGVPLFWGSIVRPTPYYPITKQ